MHCSYHRSVHDNTLYYVKILKEAEFIFVEMISREGKTAKVQWKVKKIRYCLKEKEQEEKYRLFATGLKPMARSKYYRAHRMIAQGFSFESTLDERGELPEMLDPSVVLERINSFLQSLQGDK